MFCYQCEQTAKGTGCNILGVCGKEPTTAALQDLLVYATKGISMYAHRAAQLGARDAQVDRAVLESLFATVTNVDFDPNRVVKHLLEAAQMRDKARTMYEAACRKAGKTPETLFGPAAWQPADDLLGMVRQGEEVGVTKSLTALGADVGGLIELTLYGLKGAAAYAEHALMLGREDAQIFATFHEALDFLAAEPRDVDAILGWVMKTGELNLKVMELLDAANTGAYGHPEPTAVRTTPVQGKALLVSGHDLKDLEELLRQTEGKGINVYTHGEMLPCHAYPGLKRFKHLVGNYGGAWQNQAREFDAFPGPILMTTNCIQEPRESYRARIFTCGLVAWPGVTHIGPDRDFTPVIRAALASTGFTQDTTPRTITVGFGRNAVLGVAGQVIDAVKQGKIRHFFLVGGCDGAKPGRNYFTEFAQKVPADCVILTLACGKYRFNKLDFGSIDGIPRLLDIGQCNDAYSAIQIATALAGAFDCGVNDLPLSFILSWFEQKAVAILLTLLYLGIKNIRLGPSLPAFVTPGVLKVLVEKFNIAPITTPEADLQAILAAQSRVLVEILYEDNHLLLVNKPAGLPTMGSPAGTPTLLTLAKEYIKQRCQKPGNVYLGVMSRLDAPVTGVVLLARTSKAAARLTEQFRTRTVEKTYWALVEGVPDPSDGQYLDWLIHDERHRRVRIAAGHAEAKQALLSYRLLSRLDEVSWLEVELETGRKHQIRVQLAHHGHAIVGDRKYGSLRKFAAGIALHARRLAFTHPVRDERLSFEAPLPRTWAGWLNAEG